jgi:hypothetical protein
MPFSHSYSMELKDTKLKTFLRRFKEYLDRVEDSLAGRFYARYTIKGDPTDSVTILFSHDSAGTEYSALSATHYRISSLFLEFGWNEDFKPLLLTAGLFLLRFYGEQGAFDALSEPMDQQSQAPRLPNAQKEVYRLAMAGLRRQEIARYLIVSPETVDTYVQEMSVRFGMPEETKSIPKLLKFLGR